MILATWTEADVAMLERCATPGVTYLDIDESAYEEEDVD